MSIIDDTKQPTNGHASKTADLPPGLFHLPTVTTAADTVELPTTPPEPVEPDDDADPFEPAIESPERAPLPRVIPGWLRTKADFTAVAGEWAYRTAMTSLFHLTRSPVYWRRCLWPATRTIGRAIRWIVRFAFDAEGKTIRRELSNLPGAGRAEAATFAGVTNQHRNVVRERLTAVGVLLAVLAGAAVAAWLMLPRLLLAAVGVLLVPPSGVVLP